MGQVQFYAGHPLFHALGASLLDRTICVSTAYAGWRATLGAVTGNDSEQMVGADLVVLWGINAAYSSVNVMTLVKQARARGARVVAIDPYRTRTAQQADEHLMVRPGTDTALALAVMHVLIEEGRVDRDVRRPRHPGLRAAGGAREVVRAGGGGGHRGASRRARSWRSPAPTGRARARFIRVGIGLSRHENGGMACRTMACLPALTGAYADPHGGALLSSGQAFDFGLGALQRPDLLPPPAPRIDQHDPARPRPHRSHRWPRRCTRSTCTTPIPRRSVPTSRW